MEEKAWKELQRKLPVVEEIAMGREVVWINDKCKDAKGALARLTLTKRDVDDAQARMLRFAPFIQQAFPETEAMRGIIDSPLTQIRAMQDALSRQQNSVLPGNLFLKRDNDLPIAGSVKARGGIYEVLKHSEDLALAAGLLHTEEDYRVFATKKFHDFFSLHSIHVGSTGNLGLSIGIMSAVLGYRVHVHMSADAKQWKKELLRSYGVNVVEYASDYSYAVKMGRQLAQDDPRGYFVDDENSSTLFLGYAVAARQLKAQLIEQKIPVDEEHPLFVYIPCGVGGAPGGICFGLKQEFGDAVRVFFAEPTQAPCMLLGLVTGEQSGICVQDVGLTGHTAADGLAVGRPSRFVGRMIEELVSGEVTIEDARLYEFMQVLLQTEGIFLEPSACAAFQGPVKLAQQKNMPEWIWPDEKMEKAAHIVWATGGSLVPADEREKYLRIGQNALRQLSGG